MIYVYVNSIKSFFPGFSMKAKKQYNYIGLAGFESSNMGPFIYKIKYNELVESELSLYRDLIKP